MQVSACNGIIRRTYNVIFIDNIPTFSLALRDEARRFVAFIDTAYELKCRCALSLSSPDSHLDGVFKLLLLAASQQVGQEPFVGGSTLLETYLVDIRVDKQIYVLFTYFKDE
jgi:hypothetical protein